MGRHWFYTIYIKISSILNLLLFLYIFFKKVGMRYLVDL